MEVKWPERRAASLTSQLHLSSPWCWWRYQKQSVVTAANTREKINNITGKQVHKSACLMDFISKAAAWFLLKAVKKCWCLFLCLPKEKANAWIWKQKFDRTTEGPLTFGKATAWLREHMKVLSFKDAYVLLYHRHPHCFSPVLLMCEILDVFWTCIMSNLCSPLLS